MRKLSEYNASDVGFGHPGGCHVAWDRSREKNGDYVTLAHIDSQTGEITWMKARMSDEQKKKIELYANTIKNEKQNS